MRVPRQSQLYPYGHAIYTFILALPLGRGQLYGHRNCYCDRSLWASTQWEDVAIDWLRLHCSAAHGLLENVQKLLSTGKVRSTISLNITAEEFTPQVRAMLVSVLRAIAATSAKGRTRRCSACM